MDNASNLKVSINTKQGTFRIPRNIIRALGDPIYVRLLIDSDTHQIAIQIAEPADKDRIRVPYDEEKVFRFQINSKALTEPIASFMGWDQQSSYQAYGEQINDMVVFLLDDAIKKDRSVDNSGTEDEY